MMPPPPALMPFNGDWNSYVESVYARYHADIVAKQVTLWGKPVRVRWNPSTKGKPFNFWHVVSEGPEEEDRLPDLDRCARIGWIAWVIECCDNNHHCIRWWLSERTTSRGRKINLVLWAHQEDYAVIVEPREGFALLVSAYPVHGRRAEKFAKEHATFVANPVPIPYWQS